MPSVSSLSSCTAGVRARDVWILRRHCWMSAMATLVSVLRPNTTIGLQRVSMIMSEGIRSHRSYVAMSNRATHSDHAVVRLQEGGDVRSINRACHFSCLGDASPQNLLFNTQPFPLFGLLPRQVPRYIYRIASSFCLRLAHSHSNNQQWGCSLDGLL